MISARSALSGHVGRSRVLGFGAYRALAPLREVRPGCIKGQRGPAGGGLEERIRIARWTSSVCEFVLIPSRLTSMSYRYGRLEKEEFSKLTILKQQNNRKTHNTHHHHRHHIIPPPNPPNDQSTSASPSPSLSPSSHSPAAS